MSCKMNGFIVLLWTLFGVMCNGDNEVYSSDSSVLLFREYLRINTTTVTSDLTPAVEFWKRLALEEDLPIEVYEFTEAYPVVVIRWPGTDPLLGSIMLNSHMDVVPAIESEWTHPPFDAVLTDAGEIWGRGSQDMKSISIQYFEALKTLKKNNVTLLRDVYMTLMPDEEMGCDHGMVKFLDSAQFAAMNVVCEMDEGGPYNDNFYPIFYRDKDVWQIRVDCYGSGGHSSGFVATNMSATGACTNVINYLTKFRDEQYEIASKVTITQAGLFTSVNLNIIQAGVANNIVPEHMTLVFDLRLSTSINLTEFADQINEWVSASGSNITLTYIMKNERSPGTLIDVSNPYWDAIAQAATNLNITLVPVVSPGSSDARYVRSKGVPAFGFSPHANTQNLLHLPNERLNVTTFLEGIQVYTEIIGNLANVPQWKSGFLTYDDVLKL